MEFIYTKVSATFFFFLNISDNILCNSFSVICWIIQRTLTVKRSCHLHILQYFSIVSNDPQFARTEWNYIMSSLNCMWVQLIVLQQFTGKARLHCTNIIVKHTLCSFPYQKVFESWFIAIFRPFDQSTSGEMSCSLSSISLYDS